MARISKGQQVKTFKDMIPQPNQSLAPDVTKVYFDVSEGRFRIYVPEHIAVAMRDFTGLRSASHGLPAFISDATLADVMDDWANLKDKYAHLLRREGAVKVIVYTVNAKGPMVSEWSPGKLSRFKFPMGNTLGPGHALLINYEVLYRSGDRLYRGHYDGDNLRLQDKGPVPNSRLSYEHTTMIEWSEEREQFFAGLVQGMHNLILQVTEFLGDGVENNIAALIAGDRQLLLSASPTS